MQIDLPDTAIEQANRIAQTGEDAQAVILKALDHLAWERQEVNAVKEGIASYEAGDHEPLEDFDKQFRAEHGMAPRT